MGNNIIKLLLCLCVNQTLCYDYKKYEMRNYCRSDSEPQTIDLDDKNPSIVVTSGFNYRNFLECAVIVRASKGYGITVTLRRVNIRDVIDELEIDISKSQQLVWTGAQINDNTESVSYVADRKVEIEFTTGYSSESTKYKEFVIILTAHRISDKCRKHEIRCGDNRCIASKFRCDGHNNCGDFSDEILCLDDLQNANLSVIGLIMIGVIVAMVLCYCCGCCCCCCCCRPKTRNRKDYIAFTETDHKIETAVDSELLEPSAPISPNEYMASVHSRPTNIRFPVNPNYPYFIDNSVPHTSYNYMPPPPPYTPKAD